MALLDLLPGRQKTETPTPPDPPPPPEPPKAHRGVLEIGGMLPIYWSTDDRFSVERARTQFNRARMSGYVAQSYSSSTPVVGWGGSRMDGEVTREFNPEADVVRMSLPYAGG